MIIDNKKHLTLAGTTRTRKKQFDDCGNPVGMKTSSLTLFEDSDKKKNSFSTLSEHSDKKKKQFLNK